MSYLEFRIIEVVNYAEWYLLQLPFYVLYSMVFFVAELNELKNRFVDLDWSIFTIWWVSDKNIIYK